MNDVHSLGIDELIKLIEETEQNLATIRQALMRRRFEEKRRQRP